jgi:hypothetical protein
MKLRKVPRGTFWIGGLASLAMGVPLLALGIHAVSSTLGLGRSPAPLDRTFWISLAFAGVPAFIAGGGVARLVAHRLAENPHLGVQNALWRGGWAMAVAGAGLAILAGVPLGTLTENLVTWVPVGIAGLASGALTGVAVSLLTALRQRRFVPPATAA